MALRGVENVGDAGLRGTEKIGASGLQGIKNVGSTTLSGAEQLGSSSLQGAKNIGSAAAVGAGTVLTGAERLGSSSLEGAKKVGSATATGASTVLTGAERVGRDAAAASSTLASGARTVYSGGKVVAADAAAVADSVSKSASKAASKAGAAGKSGLQAVGVLDSDAKIAMDAEREENRRAGIVQRELEDIVIDSTIAGKIKSRAGVEAMGRDSAHLFRALGMPLSADAEERTRIAMRNADIMSIVGGSRHQKRNEHESMKRALSDDIDRRTRSLKSGVYHAPPRAYPTT
jgi:hypothetical protein